ncbi:MAG: serine protease [Clostridia bacterium]|nr:serine protease [Clostridia bacterium]
MKKKRGFAIALVLIAVVLTLSLTACNGWLANSSDTSRFFIDIGKVDDARTASIVANNTIASCVRVITEYKNGSTVVSTASSGFIITEDGYVLTNRHCVVKYSTTGSDTPMFSSDKPMSANYSVVFADNKEYSASLVAFSSSADLAVLKINTLNLPLISDGSKFQALVFETQEELYYGQRVYTIGNPENIGLILTELTIASPAMRLGKSDEFDSVILDGNINHGNSGGPLFNAYSRISGIVYARIEGANKDTYGIGCAIATDTILDFLDSIKTVKINYKTTPVTVNSGDVA